MKYNTAKQMTFVGKHTTTYNSLYGILPQRIKAKLNSRDIAELLEIMHSQKMHGENKMYAELTS